MPEYMLKSVYLERQPYYDKQHQADVDHLESKCPHGYEKKVLCPICYKAWTEGK